MHIQRHTKSRRNAISGNIVMRQANATRGEDMSIFCAQRIDHIDNLVLLIGHDTHFFHINANLAQRIADKSEVLSCVRPDSTSLPIISMQRR